MLYVDLPAYMEGIKLDKYLKQDQSHDLNIARYENVVHELRKEMGNF